MRSSMTSVATEEEVEAEDEEEQGMYVVWLSKKNQRRRAKKGAYVFC